MRRCETIFIIQNRHRRSDAAKVDSSTRRVTTGNAVATLSGFQGFPWTQTLILLDIDLLKLVRVSICRNLRRHTPRPPEEGLFLTGRKEKGRTSGFLCCRKLESGRQNRDVARVNALRKRDRRLRCDYYRNFLRNVMFPLVTLTND